MSKSNWDANKAVISSMKDEIDALLKERVELRTEISNLLEALANYGVHDNGCRHNGDMRVPCDCGLDAVLKEPKAE